MSQQSDASSPSPPAPAATPRSDSPPGGGGSPRIEDSSSIAKGTRKRKPLPRWTTKIQVSKETEGFREDGTYKWRKYGLSKVFGARFPRGYYSCAFKHKTKCPATKRVQRCDEDPTFIQVTYKGLHTCSHLAAADRVLAPSSSQSQDQSSDTVGSRSPNATITSIATPATTSTTSSTEHA